MAQSQDYSQLLHHSTQATTLLRKMGLGSPGKGRILHRFKLCSIIRDLTFLGLSIFFLISLALGDALGHMDIIKSTSSVNPIGDVYLIQNYLVIDVPIHLLEIQSTLDLLKYNLGNLQYSNNYEKLKPLVLSVTMANGTRSSVTLLNQVFSMSNVALICSKFNLKALDLDTLPVDLSRTVMLHFEIRFEDDIPLCVGVDHIRKGDNCLNYLLQKTASRGFVRTKSKLLQLLNAMKGQRMFLHADSNNFVISPVSRGVSGCSGEMRVTVDEFLSSVHNKYFSSLGATFLSLFEVLDEYVSGFASNVHLLAMEGQPIPSEITNSSSLISVIRGIIPTELPNLELPLGAFPRFEKLFLKETVRSSDDLIKKITEREYLSTVRMRDLKQIYHAFKEFDNNVRFRLNKLFKYFGNQPYDRTVPKSLLFSRNQNPATFSSMVRSLIPDVDDHILIDAFVIVQNCKYSLLSNLNKYLLSK